jgi:hypothetical protein
MLGALEQNLVRFASVSDDRVGMYPAGFRETLSVFERLPRASNAAVVATGRGAGYGKQRETPPGT